jgi:hypothetical protein
LCLDASDRNSYPGSGTTWFDVSGNNNGTLTNGLTFSPTNGGSIVFDGVDDYINYQNNINPTSSFSCEAWINFSNTSLGGSDTPILAKWSSASAPSKNFIFGYRNSGGQKGISFYLYDPSYNQQDNYRIDWDPIPNKWYHIVGVFSASNYVKIYIDSIEDYSRTSGVYSSLNPNSTENLTSGYATGLTYFPGRIANAKIYNKALTSDEVQQNYQATKDKFLGQNIVTNGLLLNLDAANKDSYPGTGTTWTNVATNAYNGTLYNGPVFSPNQNGGTISLDGVDDYVASSVNSALSNVATVVMLCNGTPSATDRMYCSFGGYDLYYFGSTNNRIMGFNTGAGDIYGCTGISDVTISGLTMYTFVFRTDVSYSNNQIWINTTQQSLSQIQGTENVGLRTFTIGNFHIGGWVYGGYYPNIGVLDTLVYNRQLSSAEITQNYNTFKSKYPI